MPIAFFDLDDTLVPGNTDMLWARFIARKNPFEFIGMRRFKNFSKLYRIGLLEGGDLAGFQFFRAQKYTASRFRVIADEFFRKMGKKTFSPRARPGSERI